MAELERWRETAGALKCHGLGCVLEGASESEQKKICEDFTETSKGLDLGRYKNTAVDLLSGRKTNKIKEIGDPSIYPPSSSVRRIAHHEKSGCMLLGTAVYCILGGGIGERLGYKGVKLGIEVESLLGESYLGLYLRKIKEFYGISPSPIYNNSRVPCVVIMTSRDTHELTLSLLDKNGYFGFSPNKIACLQQGMVPAIADRGGKFATTVNSEGKSSIIWKPHGHGDIHSLLFKSGVARQWVLAGAQNVIMLQDTNAPIIHCIPELLGQKVESKKEMAMGFVAVPRKPGEAIGTLCPVPIDLMSMNKQYCSVNIEYHDFGPLLDSMGKKEEKDNEGWSQYPGNTNTLIFAAPQYFAILVASQGDMPEFINPKYVDDDKINFSTPSRVETMMQDIAYLYMDKTIEDEIEQICASTPKEGSEYYDDKCTLKGLHLPKRPWLTLWLQLPRIECFSPLKNDMDRARKCARAGLAPACPLSAEAEYYTGTWLRVRRAIEGRSGTCIITHQDWNVNGISVSMPPPVIFEPSAPYILPSQWEHLFPNRATLNATARSALIVRGHVEIESLTLDGCAIFIAPSNAKITIRNATIKNESFQFHTLDILQEKTKTFNTNQGSAKNYKLERKQCFICEAKPGEHMLLTGSLEPSTSTPPFATEMIATPSA